MTSPGEMIVTWHDAGREPQCPPNPAYPNGIDLDLSEGARRTCTTPLPYPAKRCGQYLVVCKTCDQSVIVTTAGRLDGSALAEARLQKAA